MFQDAKGFNFITSGLPPESQLRFQYSQFAFFMLIYIKQRGIFGRFNVLLNEYFTGELCYGNRGGILSILRRLLFCEIVRRIK